MKEWFKKWEMLLTLVMAFALIAIIMCGVSWVGNNVNKSPSKTELEQERAMRIYGECQYVTGQLDLMKKQGLYPGDPAGMK